MPSKAEKLLATLTMLLAMGLFAATVPAQAQTTGQQDQQQNQQGQQTQGQVTATGCLQKAGSDQFTLTDSSTNTTYMLTSSNVDLSSHVGHTVKVMGTPSQASASNSGSSSASGQPSGQSQGGQSLDVSSIEDVSNSCGGGGAAQF